MLNKIDISIVVPIYNEEAIVAELYKRLKAVAVKISENHEIVFVNDGSKDKSIELIKGLATNDLKVKYIDFNRNFGHQIAISAGMEMSKGKAVVTIDGDLQDPPELIFEMYEEYKKGYKVIYAKRRKREGETFFKKFTAKIFYRLLARLTSVDIPVDVGDFRLTDRVVVENLIKMPEPNKYIRGQIAWLGYKYSFVYFDRNERKAGKTGYSLRKMLKLAFDGITAFSDSPLKFASTMGLVVSGFAFIVIIYALVSHLFLNQTITGWTSIIISTMFIGGIQLLAIGIIGEYISRITHNVRRRPLYIIGETNIED